MKRKLPPKEMLPFDSHFAKISGYEMHYLDEGSGPVVLLVHGNPTWCFYYRELVKVLRKNFRVIVPDHIGCGLSERVYGRQFRARDRIEHLSQLIEHLRIKRYSLVMHDWGGPIGTATALQDVSRIEKIVYLNTTLTETEELPRIIKSAASPVIGKFLTKHSKSFLRLMVEVGAKNLPREVKDGYYFPYQTARERSAIWGFVDDIPFTSSHPTYAEMFKIAEGLPKLSDIPIQVIWGLKDPCFHREMLAKLVRHFPHASILEIEEASHLVLEDASELVCGTIDKFLSPKVKRESAGPSRSSKTENSHKSDNPPALYEAFQKIVASCPTSDAAITACFQGQRPSYTHMNFSDLSLLVNKYQRGLRALGLEAGDKILMLVSPGVEFLALTYAVIGSGGTPIFIDPGIERKYLFECLKDLRADGFIGATKAHILRYLEPEAFTNLKFKLIANEGIFGFGRNLSFLKRYAANPPEPRAAPKIGLVAYTSGATGKPKGVAYTQEMLAAQLTILERDLGMRSGNRDLPLLPIFSLFNLALGVGSIFVPMNPSRPLDLDPAEIVRALRDLGASSSFGSPTLWRKIGEYCLRSRSELPSLRKVIMAGAPVPVKTVKLIKDVLGGGEVYTPYGSTECLPATLISGEQILSGKWASAVSGELGTPVGQPVEGIQVKVIAPLEKDGVAVAACKVLPALTVGEIIVSGPNVSPGYVYGKSLLKTGKIEDADRLWHRMGDMGYLDQQGNLYFCGRKAHLVEGKDRIYYSVPVERIFNEHPQVARSALIPIENGKAAIVVEPSPQAWPESKEACQNFRSELLCIARKEPLTAKIEKFYFHRSFPVDNRHNAKIFRDRLAQWAKSENAGE